MKKKLFRSKLKHRGKEGEEEGEREEGREEGEGGGGGGEGRSQVLPRHDGISGEGYRAIAGALDGGSGVAAQLCS